jgi:DNA-binding IclR family transcriptional regulator
MKVAKSLDGKALTVKEIIEKTGLPEGTVRSALTFLLKNDKVSKEGSENTPKKYRLKGQPITGDFFLKRG